MKILATGTTGFFGKHLVKEFKANGVEVFGGYDGPTGFQGAQKAHEAGKVVVWTPHRPEFDLSSKISTKFAVLAFQPDVIYHMAVMVGGILANKNSPADFLHKNLDMASNIFHAAHECGVKKMYSVGSVCAYPKFCPTPFKEDDLWNGYPEETNAPYGVFKRCQILMAQTYREQYGMGGAIFMPVNMYGEHDNFDLTNSHVIPALIRKFDNAVKKNLPTVNCWGTGSATREFLYAGDTAKAIVKAILTGFDHPHLINLGVGKDISIYDLSHLIGSLMGFKGQIVFTGEVSDGQPKRLLDTTRAKELLGWTAQKPFIEGLQELIEWYHQTYDEKL
jgi:GDP-L-fucose synthase